VGAGGPPEAPGSISPPAPVRIARGRPARLIRPAPPSAQPEPPLSASPTARLGFSAAVLAASASLLFLVASVPVLLGAVAAPWDNVLTLVPSLVLAPALLALLVCVHDTAPRDRKVWSHLAVAFAAVYMALVSVVYVVELAVVEPLIMRGDAARAGAAELSNPGVSSTPSMDSAIRSWAWPCCSRRRCSPAGELDWLIRCLLLANGAAVVPILLTYFVDRAFLVIAGALLGHRDPHHERVAGDLVSPCGAVAASGVAMIIAPVVPAPLESSVGCRDAARPRPTLRPPSSTPSRSTLPSRQRRLDARARLARQPRTVAGPRGATRMGPRMPRHRWTGSVT
jgi:hypothetical protein